MTNHPPILEEILNNLDKLPEIPSIALQVNNLLDKPDTDATELAKVIMMDPSLTAQVLKICNSAEYGFSRKIATISEAVSILGYKALKQVIFTIITHSFLNRPVEGYALEKGALWENAVTCGIYARYIAEKVNYSEVEILFVGALLRDIGKVALENYVKGQGLNLEQTARTQKLSFNEAEAQMLGVNHTTVGAHLASRWNLPESLMNIIIYHHEPSKMPDILSAEDKKRVCIIHLADIFTLMTGTGVGVDGLMYPLDPCIFEHLNLPSDGTTLEVWYAELLDLQDQIRSMSTTLVNQ